MEHAALVAGELLPDLLPVIVPQSYQGVTSSDTTSAAHECQQPPFVYPTFWPLYNHRRDPIYRPYPTLHSSTDFPLTCLYYRCNEADWNMVPPCGNYMGFIARIVCPGRIYLPKRSATTSKLLTQAYANNCTRRYANHSARVTHPLSTPVPQSDLQHRTFRTTKVCGGRLD